MRRQVSARTLLAIRKGRSRLRRNRGVTDLVLVAAALPIFIFIFAGALDVARRVLAMRDLRMSLIGAATSLYGNGVMESSTTSFAPAVNLLCDYVPGEVAGGGCALSSAFEEDSPGILSNYTATELANTACSHARDTLAGHNQLLSYSQGLTISSTVYITSSTGTPFIGDISTPDGICVIRETLVGESIRLLDQTYSNLRSQSANKSFGGAVAAGSPLSAGFLVLLATLELPSFVGTLFSPSADNSVRVVYIHALPQIGGVQRSSP